MKRTIIPLLFLCGCSQCICGQDIIDAPKASIMSSGHTYYLYNTKHKGFLTGGNLYGTQASISRDHAWKVTTVESYDNDGQWDGETFLIKDSVEYGYYKGAYRNLFIEVDGNVFVDQFPNNSKGRANRWCIKASENDSMTYRIWPSATNDSHNSQKLSLCARQFRGKMTSEVGVYEDDDNGEEWQFVKPQEAEDFLKQKQMMRQKRKNEILSRLTKGFTTRQVPCGDTVYLYNLAFEAFLIGENIYKAQASLANDRAYKVVVHKKTDNQGHWDNKTYTITDSVEMGNFAGTFRNIFIESDATVFIDQRDKTAKKDCLWEITPSKTNRNAYNIRPASKNNLFTPDNIPDTWLGCTDNNVDEFPVVSLVQGCDTDIAVDWFFLTEKQKDIVLMAKRRQTLQDLVFAASDALPLLDTKKYQQICDDEESTIECVNTAIGDLRLQLLCDGMPNDGETPFTPLLLNPDFSLPRGRGWHTAYNMETGNINWGGGTKSNPCSEAYQAEYDFYQMLEGVPKGLYRIDIQAFSRTRGADLAWLERDTSIIVTVIYANDMEMPVRNLMLHAFPEKEGRVFFKWDTNYNTAAWQTIEGSYVLNNQPAASLAFHEGYFDQSIYCVALEGTIQMGIRETRKRTGAWTAWDNLRITYLPETKENYIVALKCHLTKAEETLLLAKRKNVECKSLNDVISNTIISMEEKGIEWLKERMAMLNNEMKVTRSRIIDKVLGNEKKDVYFTYQQMAIDYADENEKQEILIQNEKIDSTTNIIDMANAYYSMAKLLEDNNKKQADFIYLKAFESFIEAISATCRMSLDYEDSEIWLDCLQHACIVYIEKGQFNKAVEMAEMLTKTMNQSNLLANSLAIAQAQGLMGDILLLEKKDCKAAETAYKQQVAISTKLFKTAKDNFPKNILDERKHILAESLDNLANALECQNRYEEAANAIEQALELIPEKAELHERKAELLQTVEKNK